MSTHVPRRQAEQKSVLDAAALGRTLSRIAHEIIERNDELDSVALVGIHTRGVPLAERLAELIEERSGVELEVGAVDITFHRDDQAVAPEQPIVHATNLGFELAGTTCVLVDRGHRELPIRPDYVGKNLPTARGERIQVELDETDGGDRILLLPQSEERESRRKT